MTKAQKRAWEVYASRYIVPAQSQRLDWSQIFGRAAKLWVEIGCGHGDATATLAQDNPYINYVAFDVYQPGLGALFNRLAAQSLTNVRIVYADALAFLPQLFAPASLMRVNIFFPDPWTKRRTHKRRLLRPQTIELFAELIAPGGVLHFASDSAEYAEWTRRLFANSPQWVAAPPPPRPTTAFERRASLAGRSITDLCFCRTVASPPN